MKLAIVLESKAPRYAYGYVATRTRAFTSSGRGIEVIRSRRALVYGGASVAAFLVNGHGSQPPRYKNHQCNGYKPNRSCVECMKRAGEIGRANRKWN